MVTSGTLESPVERAVRLAGSQSALAKIAGRSQPTVSLWIKGNMKLPAECVLPVEAALGIPRHDLRPDLYPIEDTQPPAQHSAAQPSASVATPPLSTTGVDGSFPAAGSDPLEGMAA